MQIEIQADKNEVLGGPEYRPYLKLTLEESGNASLETGEQHSSSNGTPMSVCNWRTLTWTSYLPQGSRVVADPDAIEQIAEQVNPLLERIAAGHTVEWDGSNNVGRLTDDASEANEELERLIEYDGIEWADSARQVWDACEWLDGMGLLAAAKEYGLTLQSDAEAVKAIEAAMVSQAASDSVVLVNTDKAIEAMQEALKDAAEGEQEAR